MKKIEIIAEIGQNHNGDMAIAKKMIRAVKKAGADVAKFQVYEARKIFTNSPDYPWFDYNCKTELQRTDLKVLKKECDRVGLEFMASVFDVERVDWLEEIGVKRYKIASRSINDTALINKLISTKKPLIAALGMWNQAEFPIINSETPVEFLYCVSKYPTELSDVHLEKVDFKKYAGFSDHTIGLSAPTAALARGARIIEKHFTLDKKMYGPDHVCSATPKELKQICDFKNDLLKLL